jgi:hypothetical protein
LVKEDTVVMGFGEFARFCEVFAGEDVWIGRGKKGSCFIVSLIRPFTSCSWFPS